MFNNANLLFAIEWCVDKILLNGWNCFCQMRKTLFRRLNKL